MRLKISALLFALAFLMASLSSCSRESSIKENVSLKNNHSVVFAFNKPFSDAEAFADSIINLDNPDSVLVYNTLTITVNDTVYLMGFLRYNSDKIYRYIWHFEEPFSKDSKDSLTKDCEFYTHGETEDGCNYVTENSQNAAPHSRVYADTGLYSPLFIAIDGNNARDTAGIGQYIRVIDTKPYLSVPKDTLWTRHKGSITFPIVALDSFGTITSLKIDLDASGKGEPKTWKFKELGEDSLQVTIEYDSTNVDAVGNQKIYIIAIDDDKNETRDSVNLHFNTLPEFLYEKFSPEDNSTQNEQERLILHYEATDADNPAALRYFIRAANPIQSDTSIEEFVPNFTDRYLIAENLKEPYFVALTSEGDNKLGLSGRIYWDVWVTDGYDTVFATKVKDDDGTSRPRTFLLVDLKNPYGVFRGFVQYEGRTNHSGILVEMQDSVNKYIGVTDEKGYFSLSVPAGAYTLVASDTSGNGYASESMSYRQIVIGQTINLGTITLKDTIRPTLSIDESDAVLTSRDIELSGKVQDIGSQVKEVYAWYDTTALDISFFGGYNKITNKWTWRMQLDSMADGNHSFKIMALDSAGNKSDTLVYEFSVQATKVELTVNNEKTSMVHVTKDLTFAATITNESSATDSLTWYTSVSDKWVIRTAITDGKSSLKITDSDLTGLEYGTIYSMYAKTETGSVSDTVYFGFYDDNPMVYFTAPTYNTTVSIKDTVAFALSVLANNTDESDDTHSTAWTCSWTGKTGNYPDCPAADTESGKISWNVAGTYTMTATVTNKDDHSAKATITVNVVADPPTVKVKTEDNLRQKINSEVDIDITASDKYGTVNLLEWGCSNGTGIFNFDNSKTIDPASNTLSNTITIDMPGTAAENYKCIVRVTDDDAETASDTISFQVILDLPYVNLNIKQQTLTIKDTAEFKFMAGDTLGNLVKYEKTCNGIKDYLNSNWETFTGNTTVVMPSSAGTYYCAIQVTDDDGNTARDTATYNVLSASPSVTVLGVSSVTIKDTVNLDADAHDSTQYGSTYLDGRIALYEWGCAAAGSSVEFTYSSTTSPEYAAIMPDEAQNNYRCVIQVTDDDGNTARDTAIINIILDPPTVTVDKESATVREGFNILLDATASDGYGEIVKREWSCGSPSEVESNWKEVDDLNTTWKAPSPVLTYYCVVRVTDDDGNTARDTMNIKFSTETPVITVKDEIIYVVPGQTFDLNATKNDAVWTDDNVSWYMWQCYYTATDKLIKSENKYSFSANGNQFYMSMDSSYTESGKDLYCVVTAEESNTSATFSDTTQIKVIVTPPQGVITAADTVYLWSGDETVSNDAMYFYTSEWGGTKSTLGPIGDINNQDFRWSFSNVSSSFYKGNNDGTLDTSILEFNQAFIRSTRESSMNICLDYRDSSTTSLSEAFLLRHQAEEVCRKVYFRKAWENLATSDTVLDNTQMTTPPILITIKNKPVEVYLKNSTTIATQYFDGSKWTSLSTITAADSVTSLSIASSGSELYLSVLTASNKLSVYKSTGGTSTWASVGSDISTTASTADISCNPSTGYPAVTFINSTTKMPYYSSWNGSAWSTTAIPTAFSTSNCTTKKRVTTCDTTYIKAREVHGSFSADGKFIAVYVDTTIHYQGYYVLYDASFNVKKKDASIDSSMSGINLAMDDNTLYIGYLNRSTENHGPCVKQGSIATSDITFSTSSQFKNPFTPGLLTYHISVAAKDGKVFAIIDDSNKPSLSQTNVYQLDGTTWKLYGENELPYFKVTFYKLHGYYLRGSLPDIAISDDDKVYISMQAWENAGGNGNNYGPIVMKYVADSWTVH